MNKSLLTNVIAALLCVAGYLSPIHGDLLFMVGVFALSGGITNWLAVHMLFEKVPFLYGSGVIPNRFEDFKEAIKNLIIQEFFTRDHIERFFQNNTPVAADSLADKVDFDHVFEGLSDAIENSSLGGMLSMVGGRAALEPLRDPIKLKLKDILAELVDAGVSGEAGNDLTNTLIEKVEHIISNRLDELTPENVKEIVQDMIRKHLGWLVVWGGVFGGAIGLLVSQLGY